MPPAGSPSVLLDPSPKSNALFIRYADGGVFWPLVSDPQFGLVGVFNPALSSVGGFPSSDHRLVWIDVRVPG